MKGKGNKCRSDKNEILFIAMYHVINLLNQLLHVIIE